MLRQLFTERLLRLMFGMSGISYVLDNVCMSKMLMRWLPGAGRRSFGVTLYVLESQRTTPFPFAYAALSKVAVAAWTPFPIHLLRAASTAKCTVSCRSCIIAESVLFFRSHRTFLHCLSSGQGRFHHLINLTKQ